MNILNITFYKFTKINNVQEIKNRLKHLCDKLEIKGSILLSNQGINLKAGGLSPSSFSHAMHAPPLLNLLLPLLSRKCP